jgi:hypothetical protein
MAVFNPPSTGLHRLAEWPKQRACLRMAVCTGEAIGDSPRGRLIDPQRFAGQGTPLGFTQCLDARLTGFEAVAIDDCDPIPRKPGGVFPAHVLDERGKCTRAVAHQCSRGLRLSAMQCAIDGDECGGHRILLSPGSRPSGGLDTKDDLVHQIIDAGEQELSGVWLLRGALIPPLEAIGAQHALERRADHDREGALLPKSFQHVTEHEGLLDGKMHEGLSYTISPHLNTTGFQGYEPAGMLTRQPKKNRQARS